MKAAELTAELEKLADKNRATVSQRYFKTGVGQYGEGDTFIGVSMPNLRKACRPFRGLDLPEVQKLLDSKVHEHRMAGVVILAEKFTRADADTQKAIYNFYLGNVRAGRVNNWDLVDSSAPTVVGGYLIDKPRDILFELADSDDVWEKRVAALATLKFINNGEAETTFAIAEKLLDESHDLIHKAVGWMLREVGKKVGEKELTDFLDKHAAQMPRTMLRYAIEKLSKEQKMHYLKKH